MRTRNERRFNTAKKYLNRLKNWIIKIKTNGSDCLDDIKWFHKLKNNDIYTKHISKIKKEKNKKQLRREDRNAINEVS